MSVPADPIEVCAGCGREERHLQTKRDDWEPEFTGNEGQYILYCPGCQDPDPSEYRTLDEFVTVADGGNSRSVGAGTEQGR